VVHPSFSRAKTGGLPCPALDSASPDSSSSSCSPACRGGVQAQSRSVGYSLRRRQQPVNLWHRARRDAVHLLRGHAAWRRERFLYRALRDGHRGSRCRFHLFEEGQAAHLPPSEKTAEDPDGCASTLLVCEPISSATRRLSSDEGLLHRHGLRSTADHCGSTVLKALFPNAPYNTSNLQCVVDGCKARLTSCRWRDLLAHVGAVYLTGTRHLCTHLRFRAEVPAQLACWREVSGPGTKSVCIPTLPALAARPRSTAGPVSAGQRRRVQPVCAALPER
jgi:hypothetical protein